MCEFVCSLDSGVVTGPAGSGFALVLSLVIIGQVLIFTFGIVVALVPNILGTQFSRGLKALF